MEKASFNKIKEIANKIAIKFNPEKIILFGSYAWGTPTEDSDVDLFIVKNTKLPSREIAQEISKDIFPRPFPLDILVCTPSEVMKKIKEDRNLFIEDIINNGKILYGRS